MAKLVTAALPHDEHSVVAISEQTARGTGLLDEVLSYELLREAAKEVEAQKSASSALILLYLQGFRSEYPDAAFDVGGSRDERGRVLRVRVVQGEARSSLDPALLARRLLELGVPLQTIDDALSAATKKGERPKAHPTVTRVGAKDFASK